MVLRYSGVFFERATVSFIMGYGVLAAKSAALNFLPISSVAGGRLVLELSKGREKGALARLFNLISVLLILPIFVCWLLAFIHYFASL